MRLTFLYYLLFVFLLQGCVGLETKQEAFPLMYPPHEKPVSMVVVPAINKSTAADAAELINSTLTMPFADNGYYVLPISIVQTDSSNNVISITDRRPLLFRLGTAGFDSPDPFYTYPWDDGREENFYTSTSSTSDPFSGGDKQIPEAF